MINMVRSPDSAWHAPDTRIILITPPPFSEKVRGRDLASRDPPQKLDRTSVNTKSYVDEVINLGEEFSLPVVDVYTAILEAAGDDPELKEYLSDGLHLTTAAYTVQVLLSFWIREPAALT